MALERESATYRRNLPELAANHEGEFVLIHGSEIVSFHDTWDKAVEAGHDAFDLGPFFVKQIRLVELVLYV